jgi:hypothetical protein
MFTMLARLAAPFLVVGFLAVTPVSAASVVLPAPSVAAADRARNAGTIRGDVVAIDYQRESMVVNAPGRGKVEIVVPPSASIQGKDDEFFTIADVKVGAHVEVYASESGGKLVAQIIKLL